MIRILCWMVFAFWAALAPAQVTSSFVRQWGSSGSGNGQFHGTHACGVSPLLRVYVCDEAAHRMQYFSMTGAYLGKFGQWGHASNDIINPVCVIFQPDGTVYVVERDNHRIHYFTPDGASLGMWGSQGSGDGQMQQPAAAAFAPDGTIWVADRFNHRLQHFTSTGAYLGQFGSYGTGNGQFKEPYGVAVAGSGVIYVGDSQNCRVQYFAADGSYLGQWGSVGSGQGQFGNSSIYNNGTGHLSIDAAGRVFVADPNNSRVQIFSPAGTWLGQIGNGYGTGNGRFAFANAAALAPGWQVYVADETDDLIQQMSVVIGPSSAPQLLDVQVAGTAATVRVEGLPDRTYTVQRSTNLVSWTTVAVTNVPQGLFSLTHGLSADAPAAIYRVLR